jgi:hypothetical protein
MWMDANAPYHDTFVNKRAEKPAYDLAQDKELREKLRGIHQRRCAGCHETDVVTRLDWIDIHQADRSLFLRAPLAKSAGGLGICEGDVFRDTGDADYQRLLAAVQVGARQLAEGKRFDMPGFRPNRHYLREMQRFGFLPADLKPEDPVDYYAADQDYWKSFWWQPTPEPAGGE